MSSLFWRWREPLAEAAALTKTPLGLHGGTDDESSAYRWKPVSLAGRRFSVVAFWCFESLCVRYIILRGNAFGLASAVLSYNRYPEFLVALMRCIFGATCAHYYDDHVSLD